MGDLGTSVIRTIVPILAGWIVVLVLKFGFEVNPGEVQAAIYPIVAAAYYLAARWLERKWPVFGWLLGSPKTPTYDGTTPPAPSP